MNALGASGPHLARLFGQAGALQEFFRSAGSTEGRLVLSAVVVLVAGFLATIVVPWLARTLGGETDTAEQAGTVEALRQGVQVVFRRGLQVGLVGTAGLGLLVVWGLLDEAVALFLGEDWPLESIGNLAATLALAVVAYLAMDVFEGAIARFSDGADRITDHQEEIIRRVGQLAILALLVATTLTVWGVDLSGLLVGAGFLGIVVGLAARQTLGSMIAGFVLMFSRPFTIGDWVEIGDEEGIVTDITIVNTRLENFDGEFVVIPNDIVGNQPITNRSQKGHLRLRLDVGVDYESDPDHAREVALDAMQDLKAIEQTPPPQAFLKSFGDSAVVIELRFWIDRPTPPRKWLATSAVVDAVKTAFDEAGIKIPFPQRELSGRAETGGFQVRAESLDPERVDGDRQSPSRRVAREDQDDADSADSEVADGADDESEADSADTGDGETTGDTEESDDSGEEDGEEEAETTETTTSETED